MNVSPKLIRATLYILLCVALAGCFAMGPPFKKQAEPAANEARIYIFRPFVLKTMDHPGSVLLDGKDLGPLKAEGFLTKTIAAGVHTITIPRDLNWPYKELTINPNLEGGRTYYFQVNVKWPSRTYNAVQYEVEIKGMSEDAAMKELVNLKDSS